MTPWPPRKIVKVVGGGVGGSLLAVAMFSCVRFILFNPMDDMCGADLLERIASPDGKWDAIRFEFGCGATTGFSEQVSVIPAGAEIPNKAGNVFVQGNTGGVGVYWKDAKTLVIRHSPSRETFHAERQVKGIKIVYE